MKYIAIFKKEKVMTISLILAAVSTFFVHPDRKYIGYIDVRTLALLFCLMVVVKGCQEIGIFDLMAERLFARANGSRRMIQFLIILCFFSSMIITNDVALITFVPFGILALRRYHLEKYMILTVVLQTMAANLGSMYTPIGNPQNLYLFGISGMRVGEFLDVTGGITLVSCVFLMVITLFIPNVPIVSESAVLSLREIIRENKNTGTAYLMLFMVDLLVVFRVIPWWSALIATIIIILCIGKKVLIRQVDYALLVTFTAFFIFVGNIGRIPAVSEAIQNLIAGREVWVSILFSQFMSNVPAAILLAGFTENIEALIVGTNIGGLGTLIASMASLISYKLYAQTEGARRGRYLLIFTIFNVFGLAILSLFLQAVRLY